MKQTFKRHFVVDEMPKMDISCYCFEAKPTSTPYKKIQQLSMKKKITITLKKKQHKTSIGKVGRRMETRSLFNYTNL